MWTSFVDAVICADMYLHFVNNGINKQVQVNELYLKMKQ